MRDTTWTIDVPGHGETEARGYGEARPDGRRLILAHGAGAGQAHPFITGVAAALAGRGVPVVTFNFLYMQRRRSAPDRPPVLEATWRAVVAQVASAFPASSGRLVLAGKSMGGRIASQVLAADAETARAAAGLVLLGYPLHPPGQPNRARVAHLPALHTPTLVVQGTRDDFGTAEEVRAAFEAVPAAVDWHIVDGGDHSFKVPRSAAASEAEVFEAIYDRVAAWVTTRR